MRYFITLCFLLLSVMAGAQSGTETGVITGSERVQLPYNRFVQSAGKQIFFGMKAWKVMPWIWPFHLINAG